MFNQNKTKARELRRIVEETRTELVKVNGQCMHYRKQTDALRTERDELLTANGKLKHDLETESRQKEELASLLTEAQKQVEEVKYKWGTENEEQAHTIEELRQKLKNAEWRFQHWNAGHGDTADRPACPDSCVHHANPGPGASICRNCIRNPRAVDKYERSGDSNDR